MTTPQSYDWLLTLPKVDWRNWAQPHKVLSDPSLTTAEKRAVLTSWASQANILPSYPKLRQLKNGQLVSIDEIEKALSRLETAPLTQTQPNIYRAAAVPARGAWSRIASMWRNRSDNDSDRSNPTAPAPVEPRTSPPRLDGELTVAA